MARKTTKSYSGTKKMSKTSRGKSKKTTTFSEALLLQQAGAKSIGKGKYAIGGAAFTKKQAIKGRKTYLKAKGYSIKGLGL